ncbi:MAG: NAD-dependent epimerase/dehydratase family protein, partial [Planctomycetia bacterium]|nr:NAD-dependent epimerase/dehydratase family protein [Planctomycetia bacterium]
MRIFVTGGTGFVGQAVCRQLARRHDLLTLTRLKSATVPGATLVGDLFNPATFTAAVRRFAPERCVHLAWQGLPDYSAENSRRNLDAGLALFEALRDTPCSRVVGMGSCWEYGDLQGAVSESLAPLRPGMFAACKTALFGIGGALLADAGIGLVWLRPFFIYGPGQRSTSLIPSCIEAAATGLSPALRTPDAVNDFVHVDDVAAATVAVVEAELADGVYNVGSGTPSRVADVATTLELEGLLQRRPKELSGGQKQR